MRTLTSLSSAAIVVLVACGGTVEDSSSPTAPRDPTGDGTGRTTDTSSGAAKTDDRALVGAWTYQGSVPAVISVTLAFGADKTFTMTETVAPPSMPVGVPPSSCVTTDSYLGTYAVSGSALDLTFTAGTANAIGGCDSAAAGTPMTSDDIAAYRGQGMVPAPNNTYALTAKTLELTPTPSDPTRGGLAATATTFTRQ